jgi:hypothetical protein
MNRKFDWKVIDPKVAELNVANPMVKVEILAQRLGLSPQTFQRSMRRQGINRPRGIKKVN